MIADFVSGRIRTYLLDDPRSFVATERMLWCVTLASGFLSHLQPEEPQLSEQLQQEVLYWNNKDFVLPVYRLAQRSGPDHAARFTVVVEVPGVGSAEATATSMREAETAAATEFMRRFG